MGQAERTEDVEFPLKGSITPIERKKGVSYRARIDVPNGEKRHQESKTFPSWKHDDPEDALERAKSFLYDWNCRIGNDDYIEDTSITFNDFLATWFDQTRSEISGGTEDKRERCLRIHILPYFDERDLSDVSSFEINHFYQEKLNDLSPGSVGILHDIINAALTYAEEHDMIESNPADNLKPPPSPDPDMTVYDEHQVHRFLRAVRRFEKENSDRVWYSHYPLYFTAIHTGLRHGELLGLRMEDLDINRGFLRVRKSLKKTNGLYLGDPKTNSSVRTVKLTDENLFILKNQLKQRERLREEADEWGGTETVFCTSNGNYMWPSTVRRKLNNIIDRTDLPDVTMHEFRHTHATNLLRSGVPIFNVSRRLGHSSIQTTERRYLAYVPEMQKETVDTYQEAFDF